MAPKPKAVKASEKDAVNTADSSATIPKSANLKEPHRAGLSVYTADAASFPSSVVVRHTADFVIIKDLYPKASVHLLVLPRSKSKTDLHPYEALDGSDPDFLAAVKTECEEAKRLAASELRRKFGKDSAQDKIREAALDSSDEPVAGSELPTGRDWAASIKVGVHAVPSMSNLHIHVISEDHISESLKHRKHYNSFSTAFFVPLEDFPLAINDVRRHPGREGYLKKDFTCWRCDKDFGNRFPKLKEHLQVEFEEWKRE